jgi:hypothetical protein
MTRGLRQLLSYLIDSLGELILSVRHPTGERCGELITE